MTQRSLITIFLIMGFSSSVFSTPIQFGFETVRDCVHSPTRPPNFDSDGDGITDNNEDIDGNCLCADPTEQPSCWDDPDTDWDGILDPLEYRDPRMRNIDGDPLPNAFDRDSDNDGVFDYQEDRTRGFDLPPPLPSYLYVLRADASRVLYTDNNGHNVDCSLPESVREIGIWIKVYKVKNDRSEIPRLHSYDSGVPNGWHLEMLACLDGRVAPTDFNGRLDCETRESSPYSPDTDGDGLSDSIERVLGTNSCSIDTDGDGLSDSDEDQDRDGILGPSETDPLNPDSDRDGLSDGIEVRIGVAGGCGSEERVHTNPLTVDTDADGLTDFDEVHQFHTNPTHVDSDGDDRIDGRDPCPCVPNPTCAGTPGTPSIPPEAGLPSSRICSELDHGDSPGVGGTTEIREGEHVIHPSKRDACFPGGRPTTDILREFYCGPTGHILSRWYICKPSTCVTDAQGFGSCPTGDAHLITNPESIPLPPPPP